MRIMLDSNVIFSAISYSNSVTAKVLEHLKSNHTLVISQYIIDETELIFLRKCSKDFVYLRRMLDMLPDEVHTSSFVDTKLYPYIKDEDDIPVLADAIEAGVDILITGDKDFDVVKIDKPTILKPRQYMEIYMK